MALLALPPETLAHVFAYTGTTLGETCAVTRATCHAGATSRDLARACAGHFGLNLPPAKSRTRAAVGSPWAALALAARRSAAAAGRRRDRVAWRLWLEFHRSDAAAKVAKELSSDPGLARHALASAAARENAGESYRRRRDPVGSRGPAATRKKRWAAAASPRPLRDPLITQVLRRPDAALPRRVARTEPLL